MYRQITAAVKCLIQNILFKEMIYTLEVIGFTIEGCHIAQSAGAHRIELCDNPGDGGTTPSYGFIRAARQLLEIDLYPIIILIYSLSYFIEVIIIKIIFSDDRSEFP